MSGPFSGRVSPEQFDDTPTVVVTGLCLCLLPGAAYGWVRMKVYNLE